MTALGNTAAGTYSVTPTFAGYSRVKYAVGDSGVELAFQSRNVNPDVANFTYSVTPTAGSFLGQVVVCQSPYTSSGNDEPSTWTVTWDGGGQAFLTDSGQVSRVRRSGVISSDFSLPLSSGDELIFGNSVPNGPDTFGDGLMGPDAWALVIDMKGTPNASSVHESLTIPRTSHFNTEIKRQTK